MPKKYVYGLFFFLLLTVVGSVFAVNEIIPKSPTFSYWMTENVPRTEKQNLGWYIGIARPIYLGHYNQGDSKFIRGGIRDNKGKIKIIKIFLSGEINGVKVDLPRIYDANANAYHSYGKVSELVDKFKFGSQLEINYVLLGKVNEGELSTEYCTYNLRNCDLVKATQDYMSSLEIFNDTGAITRDDFIIPALEILE